jgi:MFS transporter, SP family, xylose:H+ symportor
LAFSAGLIAFYFIRPSVVDQSLVNSIKGFTISSALVGCIIGGAVSGWISIKLGRKNGLILAAALFAISALGSAFPDNLNIFGVQHIISFIIYRILGGIGAGQALMLAPMYIAEIAPAHIRGKLVS